MLLFLNKRQTQEAKRINFNYFFDLHKKYGKLCVCVCVGENLLLNLIKKGYYF